MLDFGKAPQMGGGKPPPPPNCGVRLALGATPGVVLGKIWSNYGELRCALRGGGLGVTLKSGAISTWCPDSAARWLGGTAPTWPPGLQSRFCSAAKKWGRLTLGSTVRGAVHCSTTGEVAAAVSFHPSVSSLCETFGEDETAIISSIKCPHMVLHTKWDPNHWKPNQKVHEIADAAMDGNEWYATDCMHGFMSRGDAGDPATSVAIEKVHGQSLFDKAPHAVRLEWPTNLGGTVRGGKLPGVETNGKRARVLFKGACASPAAPPRAALKPGPLPPQETSRRAPAPSAGDLGFCPLHGLFRMLFPFLESSSSLRHPLSQISVVFISISLSRFERDLSTA